MKGKVILAYSGGLDTSVILHWLVEKGYRVVCFMSDIGQEEDFEKAKEKALYIGAESVYIEDVKREFVEEYIFPAIKANAVYEGKYLLGTSLARPLIAKKQIETARKENSTIVSHGATGKGNDQVRFELTYMTLMPEVTIISPWKDPDFYNVFKGREVMIEYSNKKGIPIDSTFEKPYSMDENLMHISYEGGVILENPANEAKPDMYKKTVSPMEAPDEETRIMVEFLEGVPVRVVNITGDETVEGSLELFRYLNRVGAENGIGRVDLVENRYVGMKSRGVYETPAGTILLKAHIDLEGLVLDREVSHLKDMFIPRIAELIYYGFWFSPEMEFLMAAVEKSQEFVTGKVYLSLYKGNVFVLARESEYSLYQADVASMDELGDYDQTDAVGFIKLNALRLKTSALRKRKARKPV